MISIRGARAHNLKNINVDIPRHKLVVITGLSGSGKSSLAFDTLYAEGQRRYVESLSAYARQFLQLMDKPDVDSIEGLSPAISIEQKTTSKNPRSTVGTITEIYDYLRLLFARVGIPYSPTTHLPIEAQTISQMVDATLQLEKGSAYLLLAPIVRGRKGEYKKELQELMKKGFQRVQINGVIHSLDDVPAMNKQQKHDISVVVDRFTLDPTDELKVRLADSLETALSLSEGLVYLDDATGQRVTFSSKFSCPVSGFTLSEIEPRLFSFNSPHGACPTCAGLGIEIIFDPALIVPNPKLSLLGGAISPWFEDAKTSRYFAREYYLSWLMAVLEHCQEDPHTPFENLQEITKQMLLHGSGDVKIWHEGRQKTFEGVIANLKRRFHETDNDKARDRLKPYQREAICQTCNGMRLRPEALCVKINDLNITQVCEKSVETALHWFQNLTLSPKQQAIGARILKEISDRLQFLHNVGLTYLTLSREAGTLSGGESQRIRLASQLGSSLTGVLYVLDEPSIGLHQKDNDRLLDTLKQLRDSGNTVVVVEHDEDAIRCADYVIDMGPGAGRFGGEIMAQGSPAAVIKNPKSLTGKYLKGKLSIPVPTKRRTGHEGQSITLFGATSHNLKNVDVSIPLGTLTCVTGVSGSGKSTLIIDTLFRGVSHQLGLVTEPPLDYTRLEGVQHIDKMIDIDQSPIGRTPRSNPATYVGCFTAIREWFASLPEAKMRGYAPGRFSFNVKGGRCEACEGDGVIKIEMHFLPDVYVKCDQCDGKRYNRETLQILYKNKSIADVLEMSVDDMVEFFSHHTSVREKLRSLQQVGLGYVTLGQSATTLSGGEAQRVKLAKELAKRSTGKTLYILDEPTTGLHFHDVKKLLDVLHTLVDQGNTVIVIEHNLDVIKTADWIIDMGPLGGSGGGTIVATGTPETIGKTPQSHTGHYLKRLL